MPRVVEIILTLTIAVLLAVPMAMVALAVRISSPGPALYWSRRIGRNNRPFLMPKFRSMRVDTPPLATHLLEDGRSWLTPIGGILRRFSVDELPQLWSVLTGQMSIVGPRPALFNQYDLLEARSHLGVDRLRPGLTGWAQVNGRDRLSIAEKIVFDTEYLHRRSVTFDFRIIWLTLARVVAGRGVSH